ncbi:MAG: ketohexokinase [Gammaproteobacteria bacterium]|nr:ketohexokinase [Gammaproteobacteria bacterium]MCP5137539.1 ketohexokinase [Gammaproteobacteria bacterium]
MDVINHVERYPDEDTEVRALGQRLRRGGNAANTAVVLRQFGINCDFIGCLADDAASHFIRRDLAAAGIDFSHAPTIRHGTTPTSYITLSQANGSRSIVHHRDLPELRRRDFAKIQGENYDWIHFEGRNVEVTGAMLRAVAAATATSVEIEKPRADIETLFPLADILLFSRHYARTTGHDDPRIFLESQATTLPRQRLFCAWGEAGAAALEQGTYYWQDAPRLSRVIDSVGAGDTFNAGIIAALMTGVAVPNALHDAVQLASRKCIQIGFDNLTSTQD